MVPTARFAQPVGALILYPMIGLSGLFVPVASYPPLLGAVARVLPLTYVVSLLLGVWRGEGWLAHTGDLAALFITFLVGLGVSSKLFRWE
jgi:ABC-2 type transport system permease protein